MLTLRPYQNDAARFIYERDRSMILASVGAGKTAIALTAMSEMLIDGVVGRWLVLAPKRVAVSVWPAEARLWAPWLRVAVAVGTPAQREAAFRSDAQVVVTNYENMPEGKFSGVIFDELTRLKNPSGVRFKKLLKFIDGIDIRIGLTGSFTSNGLEDVFGQCKVVDVSLLGRAKGAFLQEYFVLTNKEFGEWEPRKGSLERVMQKIKPATFLLEGQSSTTQTHVVEVRCDMPMKEYNEMKKDFVVQFPTAKAIATNAAVVTSKLQQMSCIAAGTPVLTERGWIPIEDIKTEKIWDGLDWVFHGGTISQGVKETILCHSVRMTYNHAVLTVAGWVTAKDILNGKSPGEFDRAKVWLPDGVASSRQKQKQLRGVAVRLYLFKRGCSSKPISKGQKARTAPQLRVSSRKRSASDDRLKTVQNLVKYARQVRESKGQRLQELRRKGSMRMPRMGQQFSTVLVRYAGHIPRSFNTRPDRQHRGVQRGELPVGYLGRTSQQQESKRVCGRARGTGYSVSGSKGSRYANTNAVRTFVPVQLADRQSIKYSTTFDILNCGPRNRFVVRGEDGQALIVHNCGFVYNTTVDLSGPGRTNQTPIWFDTTKFDRLEELLAENQHDATLIFYTFKEEQAELLRRYPHAQTLDSPDAIERWNRGEIELLLAHPKSAGHGLNLQHGGNKCVFFSLPWSLELYEQAIGRLQRSGQKNDVWVYVMLTNGTVDERIFAALKDKRSISDIAIEALK